MSAEAATVTTPSSRVRSRLSNGSSLFLDKVDGRGALARRFRDLVAEFTSELGGKLTVAQAVKVSQAASLTVRAEQLQAAIVRGESINDEDLVRVTNALRRELADLGLAGFHGGIGAVELDADDALLAVVKRALLPEKEGTDAE